MRRMRFKNAAGRSPAASEALEGSVRLTRLLCNLLDRCERVRKCQDITPLDVPRHWINRRASRKLVSSIRHATPGNRSQGLAFCIVGVEQLQ